MPLKFQVGQHVIVIDEDSPFAYWGGKVEGIRDQGQRYVVKCSYAGWGENVLYLTFNADQLEDDSA